MARAAAAAPAAAPSQPATALSSYLYAQHSESDVPSSSPAGAGELYAQPSDVMLVKDFLRPWVTSGDTKSGGAGAYVHAADLYSADPDELARRFQPAVSSDGDRIWYFLSPLRTRSPRDRRKVRAVSDGTGCWHSEAAPKNVVDHLDGGRHVGYRQSFSFMRRRDGGADARTGWIMAEFHLHNDDEHGTGNRVEGLVLCKMYRSPRNRGPAAAPPDGGHDVVSVVSLSAETTSSGEKSTAVSDEDFNAVTPPRWQRQRKNSDATTTATMTAPILTNKAAGDEASGETTASCRKNKAVAADDEDLLESRLARKKMKVAVADDAESSGEELALEAATAADAAPTVAAQLHYCPQCGFHLAALQALVTLTKKKMQETERSQGDKENTEPWHTRNREHARGSVRKLGEHIVCREYI